MDLDRDWRLFDDRPETFFDCLGWSGDLRLLEFGDVTDDHLDSQAFRRIWSTLR